MEEIQSNGFAFAAILRDRTCVAWLGDAVKGSLLQALWVSFLGAVSFSRRPPRSVFLCPFVPQTRARLNRSGTPLSGTSNLHWVG